MTRRQKWFGALALVVVAAGAIIVVVVRSYTDGERPGASFAGIDRFDTARTARVMLPIGTLEVRVGSPSQDFEVDYDEKPRAADGAVFVPVAWEVQGAGAGVSNSVPVYQFQLTLVADGHRYDLQAGHDEEESSRYTKPVMTSGSTAAVVEGDGTDLRIEVDYDGLTQTLDVDSSTVDAGLAEPYYAKGGLRSLRPATDCSALSVADDKVFDATLNRCSVGPVQLTPYVGGFGWVDSATETWATVPYQLQVSSIQAENPRDGDYFPSIRRFDVTLDGVQPQADILRYRNRGTVLITGVKVFRLSSTPKAVGVRSEMLGVLGDDTRTFRNAQEFPLR